MEKIAKELLKLTWSEMDDFANRIVEIATDDEGNINDERYISQCLIDWAKERSLEAKDPSHAAKMAA